jgi:hypothetical protein
VGGLMAILYVAAGVFVFAVVAAVILEVLNVGGWHLEELDEPDVKFRTRPHGNADRL